MGKKMSNAPVYYAIAQDQFNPILNWDSHLPGIQSKMREMGFPDYQHEGLRTPAENLSQICKVLSPAISDLANCFNVTRQSIYNWLNGEAITGDHAAKLLDLALAADILESQGITVTSVLLKRKFVQGRTLLQVVQAGESAQDAAKLLVQIVLRETEQRERINARFSNRANTAPRPATADFDLPPANDLS